MCPALLTGAAEYGEPPLRVTLEAGQVGRQVRYAIRAYPGPSNVAVPFVSTVHISNCRFATRLHLASLGRHNAQEKVEVLIGVLLAPFDGCELGTSGSQRHARNHAKKRWAAKCATRFENVCEVA